MKNADPNQTVECRDAIKADVPRLLSMVRALAVHHGDIPKVSVTSLKRDVFGKIPWLFVVVLEANREVVGYAALCPLAQLQGGVRGMDMHHLFIEDDFRGRGLGRLLIGATVQKAVDLSCSYLMVGTHPENSAAQAVYRACGFDERTGAHPRFHKSLMS